MGRPAARPPRKEGRPAMRQREGSGLAAPGHAAGFEEGGGLSPARRWAVLVCFVAAAAIGIMGQMTMTASLPSIIAEFGIAAAQGQWLTTSYMLTLGVMIPCSGFLMTRFACRRLFVAANLVFLVGIAGAFAASFPFLVVVRCVQGLGAGLFIPLMQVVAFRLFPPERRGFAMGVSAVALAAGPAFGPVLAGVCTDLWGWRSVFVVMACLTVLSLASYPVVRALREQPGRASFDAASAVLVAVGFAGVIVGAANLGSADVLVGAVLPLAAGAAALAVFARRQFALEHPLLDLRPLRSGRYALGVVAVTVVFGTLINVETFMCLYIQNDQGFSPTEAGLCLLPGTVLSAVLSPFTGRWLDRHGPFALTVAGFALVVASGLLGAAVQPESPLAYSVAVFAVRCAGNACVMQNLQTWAVNGLDPGLVTHGTAIANTLRQVGGALANSLLFALMGAVAATAGELGGIKVAMLVATGVLAVLGVAAVALMVRWRARRRAA